MPKNPRRLRTRLAWSAGLAVTAVVGATVLVPSYGGAGNGTAKALFHAYDQVSEEQLEHAHLAGSKNAVSRSEEAGDTTDPTTAAEAAESVEAVEAQRAEPDPELVPIPRRPQRDDVPGDRYAMAGGCYAVQAPDGDWVAASGDGYTATATSRGAAEPFHFQATTLGQYLLFDSAERFVTSGTPVTAGDAASEEGVWVVRRQASGTFTFVSGGDGLVVGPGDELTTAAQPQRFRLRLVDGCATWPEITTNIRGRTFAGVSGFQEVRGTTDAHTHGMAFEFLGGAAHCGKPWSPFGVVVALVDCPDHEGNGYGAVLEQATSEIGRGHDPVGWPTFKDWPRPDSLTHEGTYYKWMERAWQGGMRLFVNLLVENNKLCQLYPLKGPNWQQTQCDDMKSVALQARDMRELERYIDAQYGGPGKGWYRIVTNPFQARQVINAGKLAVVMGIETSIPFGCTFVAANVPMCDEATIDRQLDEVYDMGVRQMELVNKFDNALSGVAGDSGDTGVLVNGANFLETQTFWDMETCPVDYGEGVSDKEQYASPEDGGVFTQRDGLFGAVAEVSGINLPAVPLYAPAPHCNQRPLTDLGEHTIRGMVDRGMIFDPDHMSVVARKESLDLLEQLDYSGVISSHSWSTPDAYPRIYELGGVVMPYAGDSTGFVDKWEQHLTWADPRYYFGFGYGADINGLGAQGDPRGADAENPVTYPFTGLGGVTVDQQRSGERVYDINVDGVAHYGLYPDWLQDLENLAGPDITTDMSRGAEAYLQMWERALGIKNDGCREPSQAPTVALLRGLDQGTSVRDVLFRAGQPHERLDNTFSYCAKRSNGSTATVQVLFTATGRVARVL